MANERLTDLNMTTADMIMKMTGGNPGSLRVLTEIMIDGGKIDPDDAFAGFGTIMGLDSRGIWDHRIWMLYKDVCGEDLMKMIALVRAEQLGQLAGVTKKALNHAIDNRGEGINVDAAVEAVKERLPNFNTEYAVA